jgi:hypothetical protein
MKHYILRWHTGHARRGIGDTVDFVGPFDSKRAACEWAVKDATARDDNPCWQHMEMTAPGFSLISPT